MENNTSQATNDIIEYHTALYLLEKNLSEANPDVDLLENIKNCLSSIVFTNNAVKQRTTDFLKEAIKNPDPKHPLSRYEYTDNLLQNIRQERKKYDGVYFSSLVNGDIANLADAREFIATIKEDDALYYNTALAKLFTSFQYIPKHLINENFENADITQISENVYTTTKKTAEKKMEAARNIINDIIEDYKIEKFEGKEKIWAERWFDRALFHGGISVIETTDKKTRKTEPISEREAKIRAPEKSAKCLKELQKKYNNPTKPEYRNAQTLLAIFTNVMQQNNLENKPFPLLVNAVCKEITLLNNTIPFQVPMTDIYNRPVYENNARRFTSNGAWGSYCRRNNIPFTKMDPGLKHVYKQEIIKNTGYKNAICDEIEHYLIDFCNNNGLNSDVVKAAFGQYKEYDEQGNLKQSYYDYMYKYLFVDENKATHSPLFHTEIHHDRERVYFSSDPNKQENFILTINPSTDAGFNIIYERLLNNLAFSAKNSDKIDQAMAMYKSKKENLTLCNFHRDILHGGDTTLRYTNSVSDKVLHYFITPLRPKEEETESPDNYIVAMIDSNSRILDQSKGSPPVTRKQTERAIKNLGLTLPDKFGRA